MTNPLYDPYAVLHSVYGGGAYLKQALSDTPIEELNRARTAKICYGVMENDLFLDFCIRSFAPKNPKLPVRILLKIALYMLVADYEGAAEIYSVATKKDQARKTLTEAVNMVKQSPELRAIIKKRRNDIYFPATASTFEALASDSNTLDGLNSHAVIIDELHAIRDRNLYEVMKQSTSSRRQPLVIMITTSGTVRESVFDNLYGLACDIADGKVTEDTFLPVLYELDARAEWTDPQAWIKANPGLGTIKQYATLAAFVERAKKNPEDLPGVLCKDFNVPETSASVWLSFEDIKNDATFTMQDVYNTYAIGRIYRGGGARAGGGITS